MSIEESILKTISVEFEAAFRRIGNAAGQLNEQQFWLRPSTKSNSVGIILQHLTGNLKQWVGEALGGLVYHRNRPLEFEDAKQKPMAEMLRDFSSLGRTVQEVISKIPNDSLQSRRHIQGSDETVLSALVHAVTHLNLHSGQITFIAKLILNEKYVESARQTTP